MYLVEVKKDVRKVEEEREKVALCWSRAELERAEEIVNDYIAEHNDEYGNSEIFVTKLQSGLVNWNGIWEDVSYGATRD